MLRKGQIIFENNKNNIINFVSIKKAIFQVCCQKNLKYFMVIIIVKKLKMKEPNIVLIKTIHAILCMKCAHCSSFYLLMLCSPLTMAVLLATINKEHLSRENVGPNSRYLHQD